MEWITSKGDLLRAVQHRWKKKEGMCDQHGEDGDGAGVRDDSQRKHSKTEGL